MKGATLVFNFTASMLWVFGVAGMALAAMGPTVSSPTQ